MTIVLPILPCRNPHCERTDFQALDFRCPACGHRSQVPRRERPPAAPRLGHPLPFDPEKLPEQAQRG